MSKKHRKKDAENGKAKFTGIFVSARLLARQNLSLMEKLIITDIAYFPQGYRFTNKSLAIKFGVGKRTVSGAISRLTSDKFKLITDGYSSDLDRPKGRYIRHLKLTEAGQKLFEEGANPATYIGKEGADIATCGDKKAQNLLQR